MNTELVTQLTEKYLNPPYQLPFGMAREIALKEALSQRESEARASATRQKLRSALT